MIITVTRVFFGAVLSGLFLVQQSAAETVNKETVVMRLISFNHCPFAQRVAIALNYKKAPFSVTYIDLKNKPDWFLELNPAGQVPVLQVGNQLLTESQIINDYLDERYPQPALYPTDLILKAHHKVLISKASTANSYLYRVSKLESRDEARSVLDEMQDWLMKIETLKGQLPDYQGALSMLDIAWAPFFMRLEILARTQEVDLLKNFDQLQYWQQRVLAAPAVKASAVENFEPLYLSYLRDNKSWLIPTKAMLPVPKKDAQDEPLYCH